MSLKVIGAGFGRTGTLSTKVALEALGFGPCHHMQEIRKNPKSVEDWRKCAQHPDADWDAIFEGFESQMDWPGAAYWLELSKHFPDAKIVLTVREPNSWFESIRQTIVPSTLLGRQLVDDPVAKSLSEMIFQTVYLPIFGGRLEDRTHAIKIFSDHIKKVLNTISKDRLLVFDVEEGWEPLCSFLEVDVPDMPFPKTNSTTEFVEAKDYLRNKTWRSIPDEA